MNIVINYMKEWRAEQHNLKTSSDIQGIVKGSLERYIPQKIFK